MALRINYFRVFQGCKALSSQHHAAYAPRCSQCALRPRHLPDNRCGWRRLLQVLEGKLAYLMVAQTTLVYLPSRLSFAWAYIGWIKPYCSLMGLQVKMPTAACSSGKMCAWFWLTRSRHFSELAEQRADWLWGAWQPLKFQGCCQSSARRFVAHLLSRHPFCRPACARGKRSLTWPKICLTTSSTTRSPCLWYYSVQVGVGMHVSRSLTWLEA